MPGPVKTPPCNGRHYFVNRDGAWVCAMDGARQAPTEPAEPAAARYLWRGVNRGGNPVTGATSQPLTAFVQDRYRRRWRSLTVIPAGGEEQIGGITDYSGRRVWWVDTSAYVKDGPDA